MKRMTEEEREHAVKLLRESSDGLLALVGPMTDVQWTYREQDDRWSVGELVEHLGVVERNLFDQVKGALEEPANPNWREATAGKTWAHRATASGPESDPRGPRVVSANRHGLTRGRLAALSRQESVTPASDPGRDPSRPHAGAARHSPLPWRPQLLWRNIHETTSGLSMGHSTRISGSYTFRSTTCVTTSRLPRRARSMSYARRHSTNVSLPVPVSRLWGVRASAHVGEAPGRRSPTLTNA